MTYGKDNIPFRKMQVLFHRSLSICYLYLPKDSSFKAFGDTLQLKTGVAGKCEVWMIQTYTFSYHLFL